MRLVIVGTQALWSRHSRSVRPTLGLDGQRSELVEGKGLFRVELGTLTEGSIHERRLGVPDIVKVS